MQIIFDVECYKNYFMATFLNGDNTRVYEKHNNIETECPVLDMFKGIENHTLITFNGWRYDMPMLSAAIHGMDNAQLKIISDDIILNNLMPWEVENRYQFKIIQVDHIDIINLCPLQASLKLYGARVGAPKLWELPVKPSATIEADMVANMREYCHNDCIVTEQLYTQLKPQVELRIQMGENYNLDLRSKSDAQIAEAVIKSEIDKPLYKPDHLPTSVQYTAPDWVCFKTPELQVLLWAMESIDYKINPKNGQPAVPSWMKNKKVTINEKQFKVGLGGLHSVDRSSSFYSSAKCLLDIDVAAYYPAIILNNGYYPSGIGKEFLDVYGSIVERRLGAKQSGDKVTDAALKITINGTFGKLGSKYSVLYAPDLMLQVTLTGQLALLMLIEAFAVAGIEVLSANTDGITVHTEDDVRPIVQAWEAATGFTMEYTPYKSIHYRDVNNYIAIKMDGTVKVKGVYKNSDLSKNPVNNICNTAIINFLTMDKPVHETVYQCKDITQFLELRTCRAGASKDGEYVGKAIRWYKSTESDTAIVWQTNGNKVANSDHGVPMMNLTVTLPPDLDYDWYINEARAILQNFGVFVP